MESAPPYPLAVTIRVVLADDHYLVREGVRGLLEAEPDIEVVAVCSDLGSLLDAVDANDPDVVVTDIRMPPGNTDEGIQAAERLRGTHPSVGVVVLSQYTTPSFALALLAHGSAGRAYLLKERLEDVEQLVAAIRTVGEGGSVIDPKVVEALVAEGGRSEDSPLNELTPRERDVLREMAEGKNNAAIAARSLPDRALGREGDPLDLPQTRPDLGGGGPPARQGGDPVPRRERRRSPRKRQRYGDADALRRLRLDRQPAAERLHPIPDRGERLGGSRARAVLDDLEDEHPPLFLNGDRRRDPVARLLERLDAAAVHRPGGFGGNRGRRDLNLCGDAGSGGSGAQRRAQPARLEQGRMDPQGEAPERVQSVPQVAPHPVEEGDSPGRVGVDQPAGVLQVDREPDQVLLGTVVQLALDAAPVGIGSEHEPLPRRSQLVDLGAQAVAQLLQCLDPRILQRDRLLLDYAELSVIV